MGEHAARRRIGREVTRKPPSHCSIEEYPTTKNPMMESGSINDIVSLFLHSTRKPPFYIPPPFTLPNPTSLQVSRFSFHFCDWEFVSVVLPHLHSSPHPVFLQVSLYFCPPILPLVPPLFLLFFSDRYVLIRSAIYLLYEPRHCIKRAPLRSTNKEP